MLKTSTWAKDNKMINPSIKRLIRKRSFFIPISGGGQAAKGENTNNNTHAIYRGLGIECARAEMPFGLCDRRIRKNRTESR